MIITRGHFLSFQDDNSPPVDFEESGVCKSSGIVLGNTSIQVRNHELFRIGEYSWN